MTFAITPLVGCDFEGLQNMQEGKEIALGTAVLGSDGVKYVYVQADAALGTPGTEVTIAADFGVSAGAGGFDTIAAMASGETGWVKATTI